MYLFIWSRKLICEVFDIKVKLPNRRHLFQNVIFCVIKRAPNKQPMKLFIK